MRIVSNAPLVDGCQGGYHRAMAHPDEDGRPTRDPTDPAPDDPPLQVLFPNLDRVSRSAFRKGTVSRRRINRALIVLAGVAAAGTALVIGSVVLFGPRTNTRASPTRSPG